ncbi:SHE10 [Candida oxycetoniae]|uniref:SHE10 n=1 Tax=Candida oxycetoniae TaxID=497107 RepID=A0AAI9WZ76_9ASCO|nr:SHE10 [Candida oxycetoniae]KAI3406082.2 SHE10 [Candida oxycetoniae]
MTSQIKWALLVVVTYLIYAWTYVCPPTHQTADFNKLSPVNCHFCKLSDTVLRPYVQPIYEVNIRPQLVELDEKLDLSHKLDIIRPLFESKYGINAGLQRIYSALNTSITKFELFVDKYFNILAKVCFSKMSVWFKVIASNASNFSHATSKRVGYIVSLAKSVPYIDRFCNKIEEIYDKLVQSSQAVKLQEKTTFLKSEFKSLVKFDEFYPREFKSSLINVVKEMLGQKFTSEEAGWEKGEDDADVETVLIVSTISVFENGALVTDDIDPLSREIFDEIQIWEKKVEKTIELAKGNLEKEMAPKLKEIIEHLKPRISQDFQDLQRTNHLQYKDLNRKIVQIEKDVEKTRASNDSCIETITRQEIRDDIAASYESAQNCSIDVQRILTIKNEDILNEYFKCVQDTIDILETFGESMINEFSSKLTQLTLNFDSDKEELEWKVWKKFHEIKESLFDFRDSILDKAYQYKNNGAQTSTKVKLSEIIGLGPWNEYLRSIEYHLNFLLQDNGDYLRLMRAKANLAFQEREGLPQCIN